MAGYSEIGAPFEIIYTCNCGWLDRGHSFTGSSRPLVGVPNLWRSIVAEDGLPEFWNRRPAHVVSYRQDAVKKVT